MRRPTRCLRRLLVVLAVPSVAAAAVAAPAATGQIIADPASSTTLIVAPGDRTAVGVELTLTAEVVDAAGDPVVGEPVRFWLDGDEITVVDLDGAGRAQTTVTPAQGAHWLQASYRGTHVLMGSTDDHRHSVLPATCVDEAQPGAGAVVRHAYLAALRRCPDPGGYAYWVGRIDAGAPSGAVASALARSAEALDVVVDEAYRRILHRPADRGGRPVWAAKLRTGWTTSQLWAALAASPEFAAGADGPAALVARAFDRIVGRSADAAGAAYWRDRLVAGDRPSTTWRALTLTGEVVDGVIDDAHRRALGRAATSAETAAAAATIRARRGDWRPLVAELLGHPEASTHAQRYPDPVVDG